METLKFETLKDLKSAGFGGFVKVGELKKDLSAVPPVMGVYMILRDSSQKPEFLVKGSGGFFKDKDPNVSVAELERKWVDGTCVIYIGKAGGSRSGATLRKRLSQYMSFGSGKAVGHYGGRLIWQLKDHDDLIVCWKTLSDKEPEEYESFLINSFRDIYGDRPFANLAK